MIAYPSQLAKTNWDLWGTTRAPAAGDNLERVLRRVLPLSVHVIVHTKGIVPRRVWRLLAGHAEQVRVIIGITSLDEDRNHSVEPGCPSGAARLANFGMARAYGVKKISARFDPLLPGVDDAPHQLIALLNRLTGAGVQAVSASYLFLSPLTQERLRHTPYLGEAVAYCTELCPVEASPVGTRGEKTESVYSVPLERKQQVYEWLHIACADRGLAFGTCGCKDLRLTGPFATACTAPDRTACAAPTSRDRDRCSSDVCAAPSAAAIHEPGRTRIPLQTVAREDRGPGATQLHD